MVKGNDGKMRCSEHYPKPLAEQTTLHENGYPTNFKQSEYQDLFTGYSIPLPRDKAIDYQIGNEEWIVPYNPYLSKKFKAHVNVECCQEVAAIKYINKYVYKGGSDKTTMKISDTKDEIERHLQGRYIGLKSV